MKVAEALLERSSLGRRIQELTKRAEASARYQEGEEPPEDLRAILQEADDALARQQQLIASINRTNAATLLEEGTTITDALAQRDTLKARHSFLATVADALVGRDRFSIIRASRTELKFVMAMPPAELRRQADNVATQLRQLDARIQQASWETDLLE